MVDSFKIILIKYYPHHCCAFKTLLFFIEDARMLNNLKLQTILELCHNYWDGLWDDPPYCLSHLQIPYQNTD